MREHGLQPKVRRRYVATTDSDHDGPIFPNRARDMALAGPNQLWVSRSEEHTSELQSLMRISYAVFCLKKKKKNNTINAANTISEATGEHYHNNLKNAKIQ